MVGSYWILAFLTIFSLVTYAYALSVYLQPERVGCAGSRGVVGAPGPTGHTGMMGAAGVTGAAGGPGATGAMGPAGAPGAPGVQGPASTTPGATGATGPAGAPGSPGATGVAGPVGLVGPRGATVARPFIGARVVNSNIQLIPGSNLIVPTFSGEDYDSGGFWTPSPPSMGALLVAQTPGKYLVNCNCLYSVLVAQPRPTFLTTSIAKNGIPQASNTVTFNGPTDPRISAIYPDIGFTVTLACEVVANGGDFFSIVLLTDNFIIFGAGSTFSADWVSA